jgi:DNA-dependent RNA polymerase auxiliary subunit epsilon
MKKINHIIVILTILVLIGCNDNVQKLETENDRLELVPEPDKDLREKYEQQQKDSLKESRLKVIDCNQFSKALIELKELLEKDNYSVEIREQQNDLWFKTEKESKEFEVDKTISFPKSQCLSFYVKRKNKLERMKDNWYPSFSVTEICFQDELTAAENHGKISEMMNRRDIFNEKNYDYILQNGNRLIYVSCGAKIFEEYAFSYKDKIEEIIKNKR